MTHVSLFTGIGGADLAAEWAGFETVLQVERDSFCNQVLAKHWPSVPRITDVREVHEDERWTKPTVISGGFPCQPFSAAGKRRGADDDRYLWPELLRIVDELRPAWVVGENVSGLLSIRDGMEIDDMLASMEARNYTPWILHYPAAGVGAPHRRDRVFIVAYAKSGGQKRFDGWYSDRERTGQNDSCIGEGCESATFGRSQDVADTEGSRLQRGHICGHGGQGDFTRDESKPTGAGEQRDRGSTQSNLGGMAHGLSTWLDGEPAGIPRVATGVANRAARLKALGNAIVPQQIYPIFEAIAKTEDD